jgi:alpha-L-fucosidase 2
MKKILINKYPATRWNDSTPVGNGCLGGSVYGSIYDERILINHEALFNWCQRKDIPDISYALQQVRDLMDKKEYKKADSLYIDILKGKDYHPSGGKFYPAFDLRLIFENQAAFTDYERQLDLENGVCSITYKEMGSNILAIFLQHKQKMPYLFLLKAKFLLT